MTIDKHRIDVTANIGSLEELDTTLESSIDGIGLVGTEILFVNIKTCRMKNSIIYIVKLLKDE